MWRAREESVPRAHGYDGPCVSTICESVHGHGIHEASGYKPPSGVEIRDALVKREKALESESCGAEGVIGTPMTMECGLGEESRRQGRCRF